MATSGTYTFGSTNSDQLITEAYERIGILPDLLTEQQIKSAKRTLNLVLTEWISRGLNLWTVHTEVLALVTGQAAYTLPTATGKVLEATLRTSRRNLGGTAYSSAGGTAANAFDNNAATACTQTAPNGYISYDWGANASYAIAMVGIQSNVTRTYTVTCEYSQDNSTWTTAVTPPAQSFTAGSNVWFVVPVPIAGRYFRVRETGGATLDIQELYFNIMVQDVPITPISRSEYMNYPNKNQQARPSSFYFDRQISPVLYLWPTPTNQYTALFYSRTRLIQDIGALTDIPEIPQRFFEPLVACAAYKLAVKLAPDRVQMLKIEAQEAFDIAAREDAEEVPLRIYPDFTGGYY